MSTIRLTRAATLVAATLLAWFTFVAPAYAAEPSLEDAEPMAAAAPSVVVASSTPQPARSRRNEIERVMADPDEYAA